MQWKSFQNSIMTISWKTFFVWVWTKRFGRGQCGLRMFHCKPVYPQIIQRQTCLNNHERCHLLFTWMLLGRLLVWSKESRTLEGRTLFWKLWAEQISRLVESGSILGEDEILRINLSHEGGRKCFLLEEDNSCFWSYLCWVLYNQNTFENFPCCFVTNKTGDPQC